MLLLWIALLYGRVNADLALTSGVHTVVDVVKGLMSGAKVIMMASELIAHGINRVPELLKALKDWMTAHEYQTMQETIGALSQ